MDYLKIVQDKGGQILKNSDDPFDDLELKCENNHIFYLLFNDIIAGKWCAKCASGHHIKETKIDTEEEYSNEFKDIKNALDQLKLKYDIENEDFDFVIDHPKYPFIVNDYKTFNSEKFAKGEKNKYGMIIIKNTQIPELSSKIWNAFTQIKNKEKEIVYVGESKEIFKHNCTQIEYLGNNNHSFVKRSPIVPEMVKTAVGYTRVSTEYQVKDGHSLEAQEGEIAAEAKRMGVYITRFYVDEGIRADEWDKRLAFKKLVEEINEGETLIATRLDRVGRNARDILEVHENLKERGCFLNLMNMQFDTNTSVGKMMLTVFSAQAELEKATISERVKATMQFMIKNGTLRTKPPFGFRMNPDRSLGAPIHILDEDEQYIIEGIRNYRKRYPHLTITPFARKLNQLNVPPPRKSKEWTHVNAKNIMKRNGIPVEAVKSKKHHK